MLEFHRRVLIPEMAQRAAPGKSRFAAGFRSVLSPQKVHEPGDFLLCLRRQFLKFFQKFVRIHRYPIPFRYSSFAGLVLRLLFMPQVCIRFSFLPRPLRVSF